MVLSQVSTIPATKLKTMKKKWICYATLASWILSLQLLQNSYMTWSQQDFSPMLTDHMLCMFCIQPETARYAEHSQLQLQLNGYWSPEQKKYS